MRWPPREAHFVATVRAAVLDGDLKRAADRPTSGLKDQIFTPGPDFGDPVLFTATVLECDFAHGLVSEHNAPLVASLWKSCLTFRGNGGGCG